MIYFAIICAIVALISFVNFIMYGADKRAAVRGKWRIPERVLLGTSLCGGALGGILGMIVFRHKTRKAAFIIVNACGLLYQAGILIGLGIYLL